MNGNKFKANTVIAIKLARAAFFMLKNKPRTTHGRAGQSRLVFWP
jgi:hypothetical protein